MKRWKHLRDAFAKSEKNDKESKKSGSKASKKRKYIFNDELLFLRKIYKERNTEESYNNEDGENNEEDDISLQEQEDSVQSVPTTATAETSATGSKVATHLKAPRRKPKKMDEVDLKIMKAIDTCGPEKQTDSKLAFFESLLPHVNKFDDNEWLQCQVECLQVISKIKNKKFATPPNPRQHDFNNPSTYQFQADAQPSNLNFTQQPYYGQMHHQAFSSNVHSQVSSTPSTYHVGPAEMPQVPRGAQPKSPAATSQRYVPHASKTKSPATLHYESSSQIFDDVDDDELSRASSVTVDFTEF